MIRNFENGDIKTSGRQFRTGKAKTELALKFRLRMFSGENFLNLNDGTPWFQSILGKVPQDIAEINIKDRIISTPDVVDIQQFNFETDRNQRTISVSASVLDVNNELVQLSMNEAVV